MPFPSRSARFIIPDLPSADELRPFLQRIDDQQWYSNFGPLVLEFEQKYAQAMAAKHKEPPRHALTLVSGYHALVIGLKVLGLGKGSRVLMPAVTFPACPLAAEHIGAEPILTDVDPHSWLLTPAIARAIAARMRLHAVMPVAVYGIPLPADEWDAFTRDTGIPVVIDAAAAIESQRYLQRGLVVHSLHALKPFGIGEGGLLVGSDGRLIDAARCHANFGTRDRIAYVTGENAKMSEYHAAVALAQLQRWPGIKKRRQRVYDMYKASLRGLKDKLALHPCLDQAVVSCLMLRTPKPYKAGLVDRLKAKGVFAHQTYFPPLYRHPYFRNALVAGCDGQSARFSEKNAKASRERIAPHCEALNKTAFGLPFHAFMKEEEVQKVVKTLANLI